jgi:uncharacterized protein YegL
MTDNNLTEVAVILDRSGSMTSIRSDMEGGFKQFVADQRKLPGRCVMSLYQFDNEYEVVFEERDVHQIEGLTLVPRGGTALLDAVGRSVVKIGERLAKKSESERPGGVVVMIITDGHENASREWSRARVKEAVERQQKDYHWKFIYLGADMGAFTEAAAIGMVAAQFTASPLGAQALYHTTSNSVGNYRAEVKTRGGIGASLNVPKIIGEVE